MLARLGDVLYWTGCLLGILLAAAAVAFYNLATRDEDKVFVMPLLIGLGLVVWLIGRACRYVLAGR